MNEQNRGTEVVSRLQNTNLVSDYLNISSQFIFSVLLWVLTIGIPTHTSETKEVKMTAPVWLRERVYLN